MAFQSSDAVKKASQKYDIDKAATLKAKSKLDSTPTNSPQYEAALAAYKKAKAQEEASLQEYKDLYDSEKKKYEEEQSAAASKKKKTSLEAKLKKLRDDRKRAADKGESTTDIDDAIKTAQAELDKLTTQTTEKKQTEWTPGTPWDPKYAKPSDGPLNFDPNMIPPGAKKTGPNTTDYTWGDAQEFKDGKQWSKDPKTGTWGYYVTEESKKFFEKKKTLPKTSTEDTTAVVGEPSIKPGDQIKTTPEMAGFRAGERSTTGEVTAPSVTGANIDEIFKSAASVYGGIDEIFKTDPELRNLLTKAVGKISDPKDDYSVDRFVSELENTKWFKTNAGPIRQRGFYKRQYDKLVEDLKTNDPDYQTKIDELNKTSEYGRGLVGTEETVREYVTQLLGINALDDKTIKSIANDIYLYANEDDTVKIRNAVLAAAKYGRAGKVGDVTLGGETGQNLTALRSIAAANGFDLDKTFATSLPTWLDNLNKGESIETYKRVIRDAAKTAYNVSDRVAALLDQGVDLNTIYSPYKNVMASVLEINPSEVTLKDIADKGVISNKDQMNLYDFQRSLRKDSRWQYTNQAREESSNIALQVLRDFGFQG